MLGKDLPVLDTQCLGHSTSEPHTGQWDYHTHHSMAVQLKINNNKLKRNIKINVK
jgi:hypothetical protein